MENKYKEGTTVYANEMPTVALEVRRYVERVYYCTIKGHPELKEQVYFERELSDLPKK